jgi:DMSO/TMAO reductase YedYZ molybdopterin-dependent catalytic subunit
MSGIWLPGRRRRHLAEGLGIDRRTFLASGLTAGGGALAALALAGCNSKGPDSAQGLLRAAERWNERVERKLFRKNAINVPSARAKAAGLKFPAYFVADEMPVWDEEQRGVWHLEVGGLVATPLRLTLDELKALPRTEARLEHFCVEGWSAVAVRTGVRLSDLARVAGVSPDARYVDFQSFDDGYHESWDMESAMHPQTLVAYGMDGRLLGPGHGAPARLHSPIKLGYKNTKYLTSVVFLPARNGGYWSDQGYEWYGGV